MSNGNTYENPNSAAKKRQNALAVGAVLGFVGLVFVGLTLTDNNSEQKADASLSAEKKAEEIKQISSPGSSSNPAQVWMALSANEINGIKSQVNDLKTRLETQATLAAKLDEQNKALIEAQQKLEADRLLLEEEKARQIKQQPTTPSVVQTAQPPFAPATTNNTPVQPVQIKNSYYQGQSANQTNVTGNVGYPPGIPDAVSPQARGGVVVSELKKTAIDTAVDTPFPKPKRHKAENFIAPGAFTKATVLTGLYAPTGGQSQQNPAPILLWASDISQFPNGYQMDLKGCMYLGSAIGNKTTERASVRLMTMSCVNQDDEEVISMPISGYVTGEDSAEGIHGKMIVRTGDALTMAIMADVIGGFGKQLQYQSMQTTMTPFGQTSTIDPSKAMQTGAGAGFGQAAQRLSEYYIKLAEDLQPVIEVNALREVGIVLTKGVDLMADYQDTTNTMGQAGNMGTVMIPTPPTQAALMGQMQSPTQQPFTKP
ncbi:MAG: hypothetical protein JHC38_11020 [Thiotrichales bacterium]|jgi:conjugal transfer pilus assembly protein TraB|nr:hypothetical protein [Thiotrichales bacterium]